MYRKFIYTSLLVAQFFLVSACNKPNKPNRLNRAEPSGKQESNSTSFFDNDNILSYRFNKQLDPDEYQAIYLFLNIYANKLDEFGSNNSAIINSNELRNLKSSLEPILDELAKDHPVLSETIITPYKSALNDLIRVTNNHVCSNKIAREDIVKLKTSLDKDFEESCQQVNQAANTIKAAEDAAKEANDCDISLSILELNKIVNNAVDAANEALKAGSALLIYNTKAQTAAEAARSNAIDLVTRVVKEQEKVALEVEGLSQGSKISREKWEAHLQNVLNAKKRAKDAYEILDSEKLKKFFLAYEKAESAKREADELLEKAEQKIRNHTLKPVFDLESPSEGSPRSDEEAKNPTLLGFFGGAYNGAIDKLGYSDRSKLKDGILSLGNKMIADPEFMSKNIGNLDLLCRNAIDNHPTLFEDKAVKEMLDSYEKVKELQIFSGLIENAMILYRKNSDNLKALPAGQKGDLSFNNIEKSIKDLKEISSSWESIKDYMPGSKQSNRAQELNKKLAEFLAATDENRYPIARDVEDSTKTPKILFENIGSNVGTAFPPGKNGNLPAPLYLGFDSKDMEQLLLTHELLKKLDRENQEKYQLLIDMYEYVGNMDHYKDSFSAFYGEDGQPKEDCAKTLELEALIAELIKEIGGKIVEINKIAFGIKTVEEINVLAKAGKYSYPLAGERSKQALLVQTKVLLRDLSRLNSFNEEGSIKERKLIGELGIEKYVIQKAIEVLESKKWIFSEELKAKIAEALYSSINKISGDKLKFYYEEIFSALADDLLSKRNRNKNPLNYSFNISDRALNCLKEKIVDYNKIDWPSIRDKKSI